MSCIKFVAYAKFPMSVCHIDYLCHEMVWTSSLVHQLGPVGGGWFWGMRVGAYVHSTHSFPSPTFLQPPHKNLLFVLGSHNRKTCRSARALGDNEQGAEWGGGYCERGNPHLTKVRKYGCLSLFCPSLVPVPLRLSNALSGPGTVAHVYVIPRFGRSYNRGFPLLLVGSQSTWSSRRPVFRKGAGAVGKSRH